VGKVEIVRKIGNEAKAEAEGLSTEGKETWEIM